MSITPLPTAPSRSDPNNFSARADAFMTALPTFATEANALQADVTAKQVTASAAAVTATTQATNASASSAVATSQAVSAAASADAASVIATTQIWISGTTYVVGNIRFSPVNFQNYRRKTAGAGTIDPSIDSANWAAVKPTYTAAELGFYLTPNIGTAGTQGFGVGICLNLPSGFSKMTGTDDAASENYGNYQYTDGSVMCWIPAFYYKIGTGSNGLAINIVGIKDYSYYADVATANVAGYALHRAFYNAGVVQTGVFVDKYQCSNNGGIASSIKLGNPLSSALVHNPFSGLTGLTTGDNILGGALKAAKTRGAKFFCNSRFIFSALALLSLAHAQAATSTTACAWYDAAGIINFPKGNNNNALKDINDATVTYITDGYPNCGQTGSASNLAKTAHNGQSCGVVDLNGNLWEINTGFISNGTNYYLLKTSVDINSLTGGNTLSTDAWGATSIAANYDLLGATYGALTASNTAKTLGAATQVFDGATSGTAWSATGSGIPLLTGIGGTNQMGNDVLYDYRPNEMCALAGGAWSDGALAGVWTLLLYIHRSYSYNYVGFRSALYL